MESLKNLITKSSIYVYNWVNKGGWVICCILGCIGVICSLSGMIIVLLDIATNEDFIIFFLCLILGLITLFVAGIGIYGIIKIIKKLH